jgi:hypothetical protein
MLVIRLGIYSPKIYSFINIDYFMKNRNPTMAIRSPMPKTPSPMERVRNHEDVVVALSLFQNEPISQIVDTSILLIS